MILNYEIPENTFSIVKKSFMYKEGAIPFLVIPLVASIKLIMDNIVRRHIDISSILLEIFNESIVTSLAMVTIMFAVLTMMYIIISMLDFTTGIIASKEEWKLKMTPAGDPKGYIKSDKLWSSVWKFLAVIIIGSILTVFTMLFVLIGVQWLYDVFSLLLVFFYLVVITFDIHSIGENQERRFGKKPAFYKSLEDTLSFIKNLLLLRFKKIIQGNNYDSNFNQPSQDDILEQEEENYDNEENK